MYRLLSFHSPAAGVRPGLLIDNQVYDIGSEYPSVLATLEDWSAAEPRLTALSQQIIADQRVTGIPIEAVELAPPVMYPGVLYCAGANYRDHVLEMSGKPPPPENTTPFFFVKTTRGTIIGAHDTVQLPEFSRKVDWEAEIGMVIGRQARRVSAENAMDHVAGFTILNDLSARDLMKRQDVPFLFDWIGQKCFDTACPMGPWITPRSDIPDPHNLKMELCVNGEVKQSSSSSEMIFRCETQIAYLSQHVTLYPGDVIATGTPAGCGMPHGTFLQDGDVVEITIEGLGQLRNPVRRTA